MKNLYIKRELKNGEFQITYAKTGKIKLTGNTPILEMNNGATITSGNNIVTNISFSKSDFSLANFKSNTATYIKTQEMHSTKLIKCIQNIYNFTDKKNIKNGKIKNCNIENISNIFKEIYKGYYLDAFRHSWRNVGKIRQTYDPKGWFRIWSKTLR